MQLGTGLGLTRRHRGGGVGATVYPAKSGAYSQNFNAVADGTLLRNMTADGWSAVNSASATTTERDGYSIASGAVTRTATGGDAATRPGKFVVIRDAGSVDHMIEVKMTTFPNAGSHFVICFATTNEANAAFIEANNVGGAIGTISFSKTVAGVYTSGFVSVVLSTSRLGRNLQAGDTLRINVLGQAAHLFINGIRVTALGGVNLDTGAAYTKGSGVGFGTRSSTGVVYDDIRTAPLTAHIEHATTSLSWASLATDGTQNVAGSFPIFWPGLVGSGRKVPLAFSYSGTILDLDYRVVHGTTGAVVQNWARVPTADRTLSAGAGTANVQVPMGNTTTSPTVRIELRAANDVDAADTTLATTVGRTIGLYGQSNSAFRNAVGATAYSYANGFAWNTGQSKVWQGGTGASGVNRAFIIGHTLAAITGTPWGAYCGGIGSQSIDKLIASDATYSNGAGGAIGYWDDLVTETQSKQCNAYGYLEYVAWTQGENESAIVSVLNETTQTADYRGKFGSDATNLLGRLRGGAMVSSAAPVGVAIIGQNTADMGASEAAANANWPLMRKILFGLADFSNVVIDSSLMDLQHASGDSLHLSADSYVELNRRTAHSAAKALGYSTYDGRGPYIASVTRAGAVITLPLTANGATGFDQSTAGNLDGYEVFLASDTSFASPLAKSSVVLDAANSKITITLSADPGAAVKVRSFWNHWPERDKAATAAVNPSDITAIRARGTYSDGTNIPVEPIYAPLTSN